jgi:chromate transporter
MNKEGSAISLLELCMTVFVYNAVTFGNGPVMVPLLQADLVDRRGVLSIDQLLYAFTIARVTPGQANTYVAAVGYMLHGLVGALACTVAIVLPGYLMLPLLWGYERLRGVRLIPAFTRGLTVASVGLIFAATISIGRVTLTGWVSLVVFAAALAMAQLLHWNPLIVLGVCALLGIGARALGWA